MSEGKFFCRNGERHGGDCMEFAFCRRYDKKKLFSLSRIAYWSDDSLYVDTDLINEFTAEYGKYIEPCISPDGSGKFCFYGLNYYGAARATEILAAIKAEKPREYEAIAGWLEEDIQKYNGFYILGV